MLVLAVSHVDGTGVLQKLRPFIMELSMHTPDPVVKEAEGQGWAAAGPATAKETTK